MRYREDGRRRTARFETRGEAEAIERARGGAPAAAAQDSEVAALAAGLAELEAQRAARGHDGDGPGDGVFPYPTKRGVRYGFMFRQSDATSSMRRGFTSRGAARAAKRGLEESIRRGELRVARETLAAFWTKLLADRKTYLLHGSYEAMEIAGRLRLVPFLGERKMSQIDEPDYLRLAEIDRYLDAFSDHYRPLAELLIGTTPASSRGSP